MRCSTPVSGWDHALSAHGSTAPHVSVIYQLKTIIRWRVPVHYAPSKRGVLGTVGHLLIDATTGEINIADRRTTEDLLKGAGAMCRTNPSTDFQSEVVVAS
jgi:hypothetical protein